eukprot:6375204-Ditylum_brightwellii.AAC.1
MEASFFLDGYVNLLCTALELQRDRTQHTHAPMKKQQRWKFHKEHKNDGLNGDFYISAYYNLNFNKIQNSTDVM